MTMGKHRPFLFFLSTAVIFSIANLSAASPPLFTTGRPIMPGPTEHATGILKTPIFQQRTRVRRPVRLPLVASG